MQADDVKALAGCLVRVYQDKAQDDRLADYAVQHMDEPDSVITVPVHLFVALRGYVALTKPLLVGTDTLSPDVFTAALRELAAEILAGDVIKHAMKGTDHG